MESDHDTRRGQRQKVRAFQLIAAEAEQMRIAIRIMCGSCACEASAGRVPWKIAGVNRHRRFAMNECRWVAQGRDVEPSDFCIDVQPRKRPDRRIRDEVVGFEPVFAEVRFERIRTFAEEADIVVVLPSHLRSDQKPAAKKPRKLETCLRVLVAV
jgi:hypothetical protein